jgi:hypothetical protein
MNPISLRRDLLKRRGYIKRAHPEYQHRRYMDLTLSDIPVPDGYKVRALGDVDEHTLLEVGFHGKHSTPTDPMRIMRDGNGIAISSRPHYTGEI